MSAVAPDDGGDALSALEQIEADLLELAARQKFNRLAYYRPYEKQALFHAGGATYRERLLSGGNQVGKTTPGAAEAAMHLTGRYPDWWIGRRFDQPTVGWVGGPSGELVRDGAQKRLFGEIGELGTGMIPLECIVDKPVAGRGTSNLIDYCLVRHVSGGNSRVKIKMYNQGRVNWQSETIDFVWFDEEPPQDIYSEGITRTNMVTGPVWTTFTPLKGMTIVAAKFFRNASNDQLLIVISLHECPLYTADQRETIITGYPLHERRARIDGLPMLGSGAIYPVTQDMIVCKPFSIPSHYACIGGLDFGFDHPFGAVKLAIDKDADRIYVTNSYRIRKSTPVVHIAAVKHWGPGMLWAWPHDGLQHDKGSGIQLAKQYRGKNREGLNMLAERATFEDGSNGVEAGIVEILSRMETGRFKVFETCNEWIEEYQGYHRHEGKIVKEGDDTLDGTRYGVMSRRFARPLYDVDDGPRKFQDETDE